MTVPFAQGSVLLAEVEGEREYRLVWEEREPLWVPAGEWRVKNYRIEAHDDNGEMWTLSATGRRDATVRVEDGGEVEIPLASRVAVRVEAPMEHGQLTGRIVFGGDGRMGATVIRGNERVEPEMVVLDAEGNELRRVPMAYG